MLFLGRSGWRFCHPAAGALLFVAAGHLGWASLDTLEPCTSQNSNQSISQAMSQREARHLIQPLRSDPAEDGRARGRNAAVGGLCLTYVAHNLVSDQKEIWTSALRLQALDTADKHWLVLFGIRTLGVVAAGNGIMRHFGSTPIAHSGSFSNTTLVRNRMLLQAA